MRYKLTFVVGLAVGYVLGTRAGRERYEEMKKSLREFSQNPAVRNAAETAGHNASQFAGKAYHAVSDRVGDAIPDSLGERVRALRSSKASSNGFDDDWGTSNT
jgi:hypothetical protein